MIRVRFPLSNNKPLFQSALHPPFTGQFILNPYLSHSIWCDNFIHNCIDNTIMLSLQMTQAIQPSTAEFTVSTVSLSCTLKHIKCFNVCHTKRVNIVAVVIATATIFTLCEWQYHFCIYSVCIVRKIIIN